MGTVRNERERNAYKCKGCKVTYPRTDEFFYGDGNGYLKSY